jgi:hypothetical protein
MKKAVLVLALSIAFILLWPARAYGCLCLLSPKAPTAEEARAALLKDFDTATAIFFGEAVAVDSLHASFKVEKLWKGEARDEITMALRGKNAQGEDVFSSCDFEFRKGEKYLVFAYVGAEGLRTYACTRTSSQKYAAQQMEKLDEIRLPEIRNQKVIPEL